MKKILLLLSVLMILLVFQSGCQQQITHEKHETITTETIESQEIVVE